MLLWMNSTMMIGDAQCPGLALAHAHAAVHDTRGSMPQSGASQCPGLALADAALPGCRGSW